MKHFLGLTLLVICLQSGYSQNRVERPFQLQVNLSGFALNALAEDYSKRDVISLEVKEYEMPGLSVGYHFTKKFYIGYSFHPNRNYILTEEYSFEGGASDAIITLDHNTGTFHSIEGRLTPFGIGLYFSAFYTHVSEARYDIEGVPMEDYYQVGDNLYSDALNAEWNFKDLRTLGLGVGFNQVFGNGFSLNLGAGLPLNFAKDIYDDVEVISDDSLFTEGDILVIQDRLQNEEFYFPVQFHASVGWNF